MTPEESRKIRLAEYTAIRSEITTFLTIQVQFIAVSIVLGSAFAGLFIAKPTYEAAAFFPLPFLILGLLYGDAKARIVRAARYIENDLRPTLIDSDETLLMWELCIRKESKLKPLMSAGENLRWAVFLVPLAVSIIYLIWGQPKPAEHGPLVGFLFTVDFILFCVFLWAAVRIENYEKRLCEKEK